MGRFLLRRLANYLVLIVLAASLGYLLAATSLNPRANFSGRNPPPPTSAVNAQLDALNLNDRTPITERYLTWVKGIAHGDFGKTIDGNSVGAEMGRRIGVSLRLLFLGTVFGVLLGVLLGAYSAVKQYRFGDQSLTVTSFLVLSIPVFVLAVLLELAAIRINQLTGLKIFEYTGEYSPEVVGFWPVFVDRLKHLVLPTLTIALGEIAIFSRYQRSAMLDVLGSDFVRTALAKGLRRRRALLKHALRTALIPSATYFAYSFGLLLTGAAFTEKIFAWHGMGEWFVDSVTRNDVNVVAAVTLFAAVLVLLAGMLSDILYAVLDPRVRIT